MSDPIVQIPLKEYSDEFWQKLLAEIRLTPVHSATKEFFADQVDLMARVRAYNVGSVWPGKWSP